MNNSLEIMKYSNLAVALTGDTQTFRPVTLDLGGNGMGYMNNFIDIRRVG